MNLKNLKKEMMMEESIASAEIATPTPKDFIEETMNKFEEGYTRTAMNPFHRKLWFGSFLRSALQSQRTEMLRRLPEEQSMNFSDSHELHLAKGYNAALTAVKKTLQA